MKLEKPHPELAARLWRAQAMRIVDAGKSKYYEAAAGNLERARKCYVCAGLVAEWEDAVRQIRAGHYRKSAFMTKEVEIARRAVHLSVPREKQHRALEHETVLVSGLRQAIAKTLNHPSAQKELEVLASLASQSQELCAIRSCNVRDLLHTADSR